MIKDPISNEAILEYIRQHGPLEVEWDAGNDERHCRVKRNGKYEYTPLFSALLDRIADTLDLPINSEEYDSGGGTVHLHNENAVAITYTCCKTYYGETEELTLTSPMTDPLNLRSYLYRANVVIYGTIDIPENAVPPHNYEAGFSCYIGVNVEYGEAIPYTEESLADYENLPRELLMEFFNRPYATTGDKPGIEIRLTSGDIEGNFTHEETVAFNITRSFTIHEHITNQTKVLF